MSRQHYHHHEPPPPACCSCCCGCGSACSAPASFYYPAPPPPSSGSDHLLHAIAAHLLGSAPPHQAPPQPQPQAQAPPAPPPAAAHHAYPYPYQYQYQQPKPQPQPQANPSDHGHLLLHSLLRRVAALESTIPHCFPSAPVPPPRANHRRHRVATHQDEGEDDGEEDAPPSPPRRARPTSPARERAARIIQAHFRRFLARRSRTLRQLNELAVLRSKAAALRRSLSGRRGTGDPASLTEAVKGLVFHLHAIQGGDPMIQEGKRAISGELSQIMEFIDKVLVKDHKKMATTGVLDSSSCHESCNGAFAGNTPAMNKKVSFCSNGKGRELRDDAEHGSDAEESSETSSSGEADERKGTCSKRSANGKPGLAAPLPVYMESRRIDGERR
ncbi:hypothetical protein GUJ93_ZPchr0005g14374 [Zizania palustris]|uniref:BAG domain-containing protein n=1 Tax=Zizania palustris TaxID=103762 RepID=A0A8J5W146_ZIZPA|nr:hypothetical protein GUJ93_ZPchr0005g14374 [Zizania palustris]